MALYFMFRESYKAYYERQLAQLGGAALFRERRFSEGYRFESGTVSFCVFYIREFNKSYYERSDLYEDIY